jgi:hypothetical protein
VKPEPEPDPEEVLFSGEIPEEPETDTWGADNTGPSMDAPALAPASPSRPRDRSIGQLICSGAPEEITVSGTEFAATFMAHGLYECDGLVVFYVARDTMRMQLKMLHPYTLGFRGVQHAVVGGPIIDRAAWGCVEVLFLPAAQD